MTRDQAKRMIGNFLMFDPKAAEAMDFSSLLHAAFSGPPENRAILGHRISLILSKVLDTEDRENFSPGAKKEDIKTDNACRTCWKQIDAGETECADCAEL